MDSLWTYFTSFFKIGLFTFGGGYAMLPMLEKEVVDQHGWSTQEELLDYYAIAQCTPGVIAVNVATLVGYSERGFWGSLFATLGVVTPSVLVISLLAYFIQQGQELLWLQHALAGIRLAVCVLMSSSVLKMYRRSAKESWQKWLVLPAFYFAAFTDVSLVLLILVSALLGFLNSLRRTEHE